MKPVIAITIGDFNGIGPEVALRAAAHSAVRKICLPLLIGPLNVFEQVRTDLRFAMNLRKASAVLPKTSSVMVIDVGDGIGADIRYGTVTKTSGRCAGLAVEHAVTLCTTGKAHAMVTAPLSKEALNLAGYSFPGQTEMIALLTRSRQYAMMLVSAKLRIGLVTIHVPIKTVSELLTKEKIAEKTIVVHESLKRDFQIKKPKIAILALNPHAGEHGMIGDEEQTVIKPALEELRQKGVLCEGPFPSDGFFGAQRYKSYDAVIAMYHDQGLIPLKMSSFGGAVNFSAGLGILRTSPDHGTAYDIAGKGTARIDSMLEAVKLAVRFAKVRRHD